MQTIARFFTKKERKTKKYAVDKSWFKIFLQDRTGCCTFLLPHATSFTFHNLALVLESVNAR